MKIIRSLFLLLGNSGWIRRTRTKRSEERWSPSDLSIRRMFTPMLIMKAKIQTMRWLIATIQLRHLSMVVVPHRPMEKLRRSPVKAAIIYSDDLHLQHNKRERRSVKPLSVAPRHQSKNLKEFVDDRKKIVRGLQRRHVSCLNQSCVEESYLFS